MELVPGDVISDCIAFTGLYENALTRRVVTGWGGLALEQNDRCIEVDVVRDSGVTTD